MSFDSHQCTAGSGDDEVHAYAPQPDDDVHPYALIPGAPADIYAQ